MGQIANAATVSIIEAASGQTRSTTKTTSSGEFELTFSGGFVPVADVVYIIEGVKGLDTNRPGSDAVRVRTFVQFSGGAWKSMVSGFAGVYLDTSTTALCIMQGYYSKSGSTGPEADALNYIDLVERPSGTPGDPDPLRQGQTVVGQATYQLVHSKVKVALEANQDPVQSITYTAGAFNVIEAGKPAIFDLYPRSGSAGTLISIYGINFDSDPKNNTVIFNGAPGAVKEASPTKLLVWVPDDATSGDVIVQAKGNQSQSGVAFTVVPSFGGKFKGTQ